MLTVTDVSLQFQGCTLYKHVDLKFAPGNCYGIIGANGAGKSTLLRILSGALEPTTGSVSMVAERRADLVVNSILKYVTDIDEVKGWASAFPSLMPNLWRATLIPTAFHLWH